MDKLASARLDGKKLNQLPAHDAGESGDVMSDDKQKVFSLEGLGERADKNREAMAKSELERRARIAQSERDKFLKAFKPKSLTTSTNRGGK